MATSSTSSFLSAPTSALAVDSSPKTLQTIVDAFYKQKAAMVIGSYRMCDFELNTLPPGLIDHKEWTDENGPNNALRINGLGAPRAFLID